MLPENFVLSLHDHFRHPHAARDGELLYSLNVTTLYLLA